MGLASFAMPFGSKKEVQMVGLNKVFLMGYIGNPPEVSTSEKGYRYTRLRLATRRSHIDHQTQERREETVWHTVFVFGRSGENCEKYLKRGSPVLVEGHLSNYSTEENGQKRWKSAITAERVEFLSNSPNSQRSEPSPS